VSPQSRWLNYAMDSSARRRRRASVSLAVLGSVLLVVGVAVFYAGRALFDSGEFGQRSAAAVSDERVRQPLAEAITDGLIENAESDLVNARPLLVALTAEILDTGAYEAIHREASEKAHKALFTREGNRLVLNLADGAALTVDALSAVSPGLAAEVPADSTARLNELVESDAALDLLQLAEDVRFLGIAMPLAALLVLAGAVGIERDRRRGLLAAAVAVAVAFAAGLAALLGLRALVLAGVESGLRDAAAGVWDAFLGDLAIWLAIGGVVALILAAAISTRRRLDALEPLHRLAAFARRPEGTVAHFLRALLVLALGVFAVTAPEAFLRALGVAVGAYAIFFGLAELFLLVVPPPPAGAPAPTPFRERVRPGPALGAIAAVALFVVIVIVAGGEGERGPRMRPAASIERCNGFAELCDRRLDEVVFPSVHNAMSAANDGFLLANNRRGIADQLDAGVRGLLIDAHYGVENESGQVVTDFEKEGKTRQEVVDAAGEEFVKRAERLVGRIFGTDVKGTPGVYFCHVFCELGAVPLVEELEVVREFLEMHSDEVVLLFIEDYVKPADIERGFEEARLADYAYVHEPGEPLPTLREMIASGKRLLVLAENRGGGGIPWYHDGFELAQETPFTFHSIAELDGKQSCTPNRGEPGNPLFQLNHWVEELPRSIRTAAAVNAYDFLQGRAERCARLRDALPNIVAVDFWESGDVFEVARELNGLPREIR